MSSSYNFSSRGQFRVVWRCNPWDNTEEARKTVLERFSKKYGIPRNRIKIETDIIRTDDEGNAVSLKSEVIDNIQSPAFQQSLFEEYVNLNGIQNIDMNRIREIDDAINTGIDYDVYEKFGRIIIKKIEFDSILSYGSGNVIDFTVLSGLVPVCGVPANKSGKTTALLEIPRWILYGTFTKAKTMDEMFNLYLPDVTECWGRCFLSVDGEDFLIERKIMRPKKRTAKSKASSVVKYYRIVDGIWDVNEPLEEYELENESGDYHATNRKIKECLPRESDFDMVISANSENLSALVNVGSAEKSRLFSRWTGLLPLENKETLARDKWNREISPKLLSNHYNSEELKNEILKLQSASVASGEAIEKYRLSLAESEKKIRDFEEEKEKTLLLKRDIDPAFLNIDVTTVEKEKEELVAKGKVLRESVRKLREELAGMENIQVDVEGDRRLVENRERINRLTGDIATVKQKILQMRTENKDLENSRACPLCKRLYEEDTLNVINAKTAENAESIEKMIREGTLLSDEKKRLEEENVLLEENAAKVAAKVKLELQAARTDVSLEKTTASYLATVNTIVAYNKNREDIRMNNEADLLVSNLAAKIRAEHGVKDNLVRSISHEENLIETNAKSVAEKEELITRLGIEEEYVRHYKLYLELVGRNGIKKIILRKVLPVINGEIDSLLSGLDDFTVEIVMNIEKNDIVFNLVKYDGEGNSVRTNMVAASGYESTLGAIALRTALSKFSTISIPNYILYDEICARTAEENFENLIKLLERVKENYQCVFVISHNSVFNSYFERAMKIVKEDGISKIIVSDEKN
jgi:hypothetical protein